MMILLYLQVSHLQIDDVDEFSSNSWKSNLTDTKDKLSLTNLIKEVTCFKFQNSTLLNLILANRPKSFMIFQKFDTCLSDCSKLFCSVLRAYFEKIPFKIVKLRK